MKEFRALLALLQRELMLQEKLLELVVKERAAIVKLNRDEIEKYVEQKERVLAEMRSLEEKRSVLIASMESGSPAQGDGAVKLSSLLESCDSPQLREQLTSTGENLKKTATTAHQLNADNSMLIRQSLGIISSTLAILHSAANDVLPTYSGAGKIENDGGRAPTTGRIRTRG